MSEHPVAQPLRPRWPRLLPLLALPLLILATACEPVEGKVAWTGDSISVQASAYADGGLRGADKAGLIGLGWEVEDATPRLRSNVNTPAMSPEMVVVEFGQNDWAGPGGKADYSQADKNEYLIHVMVADPAARILLVMPVYYGPNDEHAKGIAAVRANIDALMRADLGRTVCVVDLAVLFGEHPEFVAADGIHLADGPAATAFVTFIYEGLEACT